MGMIHLVLAFLKAFLAGRAALAAENPALRHQLAVLQRSVKRPKLRKRDRIFWSWLSRVWSGWKSALLIVQPDTVVRGHRQGFRLYWRWKSWKKQGRPLVDREIRDLIRRMCRENPTWGAPRILSELLLLGHAVAESTVSKYLVRQPKPPSQNWRTFLENHVGQLLPVSARPAGRREARPSPEAATRPRSHTNCAATTSPDELFGKDRRVNRDIRKSPASQPGRFLGYRWAGPTTHPVHEAFVTVGAAVRRRTSDASSHQPQGPGFVEAPGSPRAGLGESCGRIGLDIGFRGQ